MCGARVAVTHLRRPIPPKSITVVACGGGGEGRRRREEGGGGRREESLCLKVAILMYVNSLLCMYVVII